MVIFIKFIRKFFKSVILSSFCLYLLDFIFVSFNFVLPINLYTIFITSTLGIFGLFGLIVFKFFIL